ncbi:hypothetical protein BC830DRAFT_1186155 [Chytriomyces sp. MP71]|nr:hypothetical protein BC830DRAFT_1186155 [Chytriomyces sp. MP71]
MLHKTSSLVFLAFLASCVLSSPIPQTNEETTIAALQEAQLGQPPATQQAIQQQIQAILNQQAGLQAIQQQIQAILNQQAGTVSGVSNFQNQIAALQAAQVGQSIAIQQAIQEQIQSIIEQEAAVA